METLNPSTHGAVNEVKEFDFDEFDEQVQQVAKFLKNKSKVNKWADDELGGRIEKYIFDGLERIMEYLEGWQDNCADNWDEDPEGFEEEYGTYKNIEYVESMWDGLWDGLRDDFGPDAEAISDVFDEMWSYCAKKNFPFAF